MGYQTQIFVSVILLSMSAIGAAVGTYMLRSGLSARKEIIEHKQHVQTQRPDVMVQLFLNPAQGPGAYNRHPLPEYILMIQNRNKASADILNCRITFVFPNIIAEVISHPLISSGEDVSVSGLRIRKETEKGIRTYEEKPPNNPIANLFSLEAEKTDVDGSLTNTNVALFTCLKWPKNVDFGGRLVIDQSKKPQILKTPGKIGTYSGTFSYIVDGKSYEEQVYGDIQPITSG